MRRRMGMMVAMAATATLLLPVGAMAATKTINAVVKGDANSKVTLKFKVKNGSPPSKLKSFSFKNVDSPCPDGGEFNGESTSNGLSPMLTFVGGNEITDTLGFRHSGTVDPKAKRVKDGKIEFAIIEKGQLVESCGTVAYKTV